MELVVAGLKIELRIVDVLCLATQQQKIRRPFSKYAFSNITGVYHINIYIYILLECIHCLVCSGLILWDMPFGLGVAD